MKKKHKLPKNNQDLKILGQILSGQIDIDSYLICNYEVKVDRLLVCYVVLTTNLPISLLNDRIKKSLPELFQPFSIFPISHIPYQEDGEIDYKQLLHACILYNSGYEVAEENISRLSQIKEMGFILNKIKHLHFSRQQRDKLLLNSTIITAENEVNSLILNDRMLAISYGGELQILPDTPKTLTMALLETATKYPTKGISCIEENGQKIFLTYSEILIQAQSILSGLRNRGCQAGDCAILQIAQLHTHFAAFWGCILGGIIPVVVNVAPNYNEKNALTDKFFNVYRLLNEPIIITDDIIKSDISHLRLLYQLPNLLIYTVEELCIESPTDAIDFSDPTKVLFYQLSSGSTGIPKCIQITHKGVIAHIQGSIQLVGYSANDVCLNWMPYDHSGSAIWAHLRSLYLGCNQIAVKTNYILSNPLRWLDLMEEYKVTHSWSPNFGYKLVTEEAKKLNKCNWNLSSLKYLKNGSEQLTLNVLSEFIEFFKSCGITAKMLQPAYGMSETSTVIVYNCNFNLNTDGVYWINKDSFGNNLIKTEDHNNALAFIISGTPIPGVSLRITDGDGNILPEGAIGHLEIKGNVITPGYINNYEANKEIFTSDGWLNSGDMGFIINGKLILTGRQKEIIIINGANYFCYEIEDIVSNIPGVLPSFVASTSILDETIGTERLAVFFVTDVVDIDILAQLCKTIKNQLAIGIGMSPTYVIPVAKEQFHKTTGGKIQRTKFKKDLETGKFQKIIEKIIIQGEKSLSKPITKLEEEVFKIWGDILKTTTISTEDSFFALGGNSILAMRVINSINKALDVNINLLVIFKHSTIKELAHYIEQSHEDNPVVVKSIAIAEEGYPLSFAQERLWFIEKYVKGTNAYNEPMIFNLSKEIDLNILEKSIKSITFRHEILRTLIKEDVDGNGYQVVINETERPLEIPKILVKNLTSLEKEMSKEINHIYSLSNEYPIRVTIYILTKDNSKEYYLSIVVHHIAIDGWSIDIFMKELQEYYRYYSELAQNKLMPLYPQSELNLPELTIQYRDFAVWQRNYLIGSRLGQQLTYWKKKLQGYEILSLITDYTRPKEVDFKGANVYFELDSVISSKLRILAKELNVSLYSIMLAGYYLMLRVYSNQNDIIVGTPIANRHYAQIENLIGFFVNTLVLRINIDSEDSVKEFIKKVGQEVVDAQLNQDLPFEKLVDEIEVTKDSSRHPIFQVMFGVQSFGNELEWRNGELKSADQNNLMNLLQPYEKSNSLFSVAKFDISTIIDDSKATLRGSFNYALSLYNQETIERFVATYTKLLSQIADLADKKLDQALCNLKISDIVYLSDKQYNQIIEVWNATDMECAQDKTIQALFEEQVERSPDNVALIYNGTKLTYMELNERANKLAHYLVTSYDVKPDTLIVLCLDRSEYMLIAILAILKAGGAYIPIDVGYPNERVENILQDSATKIVLTNLMHKEKLDNLIDSNHAFQQISVLPIDDVSFQDQLSLCSTKNPITATRNNNLAYVIYTSGTTGKPKGVMIEHRSYVITIQCFKNTYFANQNTISTYSITNYVFDIFGLEYGLPLLYGGSISLATNDFSLLDCSNYDFIQMTPSLGMLKLDNLLNISHLKLLIGGESLTIELLNASLSKSIDLINVYGPTETTIWSTSKIYHAKAKATNVSLGKPLFNEKVYVLDANLLPLPVGAIGELYIGGSGLARGYLNQPDLTSERFIPNPFQTEDEKKDTQYGKKGSNGRIYKTGDLVRWMPDGNLEYIGRNDFQVKIRGYRIELGETENALLRYEGITQSVVLAKESMVFDKTSTGDNKYLVAYYISDEKLDEDSIFSFLHDKLPEYMVPSILLHLKKLPLTINGKVDKKALPDTKFAGDIDNYCEPRNELEKKVCLIWIEVLRLPQDKVGIHDDFFRLGGNSILAIKLITKLNNTLSYSISVAYIFKYNTIAKLAHYIEHNNEDNKCALVIEPSLMNRLEDQVLSFAQERLWFIEKYERGTNAYNIPMVFKLNIITDNEINLLEKSVRAVASRHEVLRTLIREDDEGNGYQLISDDKEFFLDIRKIRVKNREELDEEISREVNHIYNLNNEYPIRVFLYQLQKEYIHDYGQSTLNNCENYICIVMHHIAFDGWSIDILIKELQEYYKYYSEIEQNKLKGLDIQLNLNLPKLSIQYKDFAIWQKSYLTGDTLEKQLTYWKDKLAGYEKLNLITDYSRSPMINYQGDDIYFELDKEVSKGLQKVAQELKITSYSILLAAYYLMLRVHSNQNDIVLGIPVVNRHYPQVQDLIGLFVNTLPLRIIIDESLPVEKFIEKVAHEVIEAQLNQDLPFERLVSELMEKNDISRHPIFQVIFQVGNFDDNITNMNELLKPDVVWCNKFKVAKFDLSLLIDDSNEELRGRFNYASSLYDKETILRFADTYIKIIAQFSELISHQKNNTEKISIRDLNYLSLEQEELILHKWNSTTKEYPHNKTIHDLFEESVKSTPGAVAVIYEDKTLTYKELNYKANQLAHYIQSIVNVEPDDLLVLFLDRSQHMIISILAILKVGAAYVPVDPDYPRERIEYILRDTKTKMVLTNVVHQQTIEDITASLGSSKQAPHIFIVDSEDKLLESELTVIPNYLLSSTNLAYVIYTSGTTGHPKGVMMEHHSVINRIKWMNDTYPLNKKDGILQKTPYVFDVSVWELLWPILYGSTLVFAKPEGHKDTCYLIDLINTQLITTLHFVPSMLHEFLFYLQNNIIEKHKLNKLRYIFCSGEALRLEDAHLCKELLPHVSLQNLYGPTESCIDSLYYDCNNKLIKNICIGKPIDNTSVYILSPNLQPLPIGVIGELYIGGVGLARGYLNRHDLTAERFIENPFQLEKEKNDTIYGEKGRNTRIYKTGDLVRWAPDGNIDYIGRNDFQVKIRGYRIELEEVENALKQYPGIQQSVVIVHDHLNSENKNNSKYLIGYYTSYNGQILDEHLILKFLSNKLPDYMIPKALLYLPKLPLTLNGKLDRPALPDPDFVKNEDIYIAPRNESEKKMCKIWADILGLNENKISINDDFFMLGGDSLFAMRLVVRIKQIFDIDMPLKAIFNCPSLQIMSNLVVQ